MQQVLSRAGFWMFLFDFCALFLSSCYWYGAFKLPAAFMFSAAIVITVSGIIANYLKCQYKIREFKNTFKNCYLLFEGVLFAHALPILFGLIFYDTIPYAKFIVANIVSVYAFQKLYRLGYRFYLLHIKKTKKILIIGTNRAAKFVADEILEKKALKTEITGFVKGAVPDEDDWVEGSEQLPVFPFDDFEKIMRENEVNIVIVASPENISEKVLTTMVANTSRRVKIYRMPDFYEALTEKFFIDKYTLNELFFDFTNRRSAVYDFCKRAYDIIAATIILTVTFPILLYIAVRVKLTDGGNPVYTQNRVGKDGKVFKAYKLRTMYMNDYVPTSENLGKASGLDDDNRIIPFCKFVRKARFDEIPQMINILKGEMSIVGPRAEWDELVNIYTKEVGGYSARMWSRTGWTGWAQIKQGHCVTSDDVSEKLRYDLYYLKHRTLAFEIFILVKAVFMALGGRHE